jgi:hypothetical protein
MLDRLLGFCFSLLAGAVAIYVAVRLIVSVAGALLVIVAVIGGLAILGFAARLLWSRRRLDRW